MTVQRATEEFLATMRRASYINSAISLLTWDQRTIMPENGSEGRANTIGVLSSEVFGLLTSKEYGALIQALEGAQLDGRTARMIQVARREYDKDTKIPPKLYEAYVVDASRSQDVWTQAKRTDDFALFAPYLQKMIDYSRQFADLWGYEGHPYDAMLDGYEPGLTVKRVDGLFKDLREATVDMLAKVPERPGLVQSPVCEDRQRQIGEYLLEQIGFDMRSGNLHATEHPFCSGVHAGDVRLTTKYLVDDPASSIFSVLHEGGHGLYDQNIDPQLDGTNLHDGASMGIHESQSRFWENIVGRSRAFWQVHFDDINRMAGGGLAADADAFFRGVNRPQRSLIRIEADELTYNLHIIIRYELEKEIAAGKLGANDLRGAWNDRYEEYLGIRPATDSEGILQDIHWSGGLFGYFPTYAIGNLYCAQFAAALQRELGPLDSLIRRQDGLASIKGWLKENIHWYGALVTPDELIERVTGEPLSANYLIDYLGAKLL